MAERTIGITLLGCGVVGSGVARILAEQRDLIARRTGLVFDVRHVVVRDPAKVRGAGKLHVHTDANAAINDPQVHVVVELIGGTGAAADLVRKALALGKPVVTANKSLLAAQGRELFALAKKHNSAISFEASCGGGIPIIQALTHGLIANEISALVGIVNGTCNVILTRMTVNGWTYKEALAEAQRLGYAEADPTMDVSGRDTAQKLAILASLAFDATVSESDIHIEGIDTLDPLDIRFAKELGYVIKLLAIAERAQGSAAGGAPISLRVHPTLVHKQDVLADVSGSFNAISVYGHALGHCLFYGRGAGQMPTASAVVSDLIQTALGTAALAFKQLQIFADGTPPANILPFEDLQSRYYLRVLAKDQPGVMARVAAVLGKYEVSISAILQHESAENNHVPIVITTHLAKEGALQRAIREINSLPVIQPPAACLRIIDQPKESSAIQ
ncbi:MAG: homoserine dehydrogenase [Phycisphaerales bacterium]|nr:homoserine dehydrogenase [Phycisphaerales bacterium]